MEGKTEFDKLMREAVALKTAQLSKARTKFDSWPQFHQAGLYYSDSFKNIRDASTNTKISAFEQKKNEGTELFKQEEFQKALFKYEEALTVFRWVDNKNKNWKNSGIEDSDLTVHNEEPNEEAKQCVIAVYLNIALCNIKLEIWKEAVRACDEALKIDPKNTKALYRKAQAMTMPASSGINDYQDALKLLKEAALIDPKNVAIRQKITEFKEFIKDQTEKSKQTFNSFFKKPAYDDAAPQPKQNSAAEIEDMIVKGEVMVKDLLSNGQQTEAKNLKKKLNKMKKYRSDAKKAIMDFENPSKEMLEQAEKFGLDLTDPLVKSELKRLKEQGIQPLPSTPRKPKEAWGGWFWVLVIFFSVLILMAYLYESSYDNLYNE